MDEMTIINRTGKVKGRAFAESPILVFAEALLVIKKNEDRSVL
jgi:hypothetical protein